MKVKMKDYLNFRYLFFHQKQYYLIKDPSGKHQEVAVINVFSQIFQFHIVTPCGETLALLCFFPSLLPKLPILY